MSRQGLSPSVSALALVILCALVPIPSVAQPAANAAVVWVASESVAGEADSPFASVVYDSLVAWLMRRAVLIAPGSGPQRVADAAGQAATGSADLSLVALVGQDGEEVTVSLIWAELPSGHEVSRTATRGPADLGLDRVVFKAVETTWPAVAASLAGRPPRADAGSLSPALSDAPASAPTPAGPAGAAVPEALPAGGSAAAAPEREAPRRFQLVLGFSTFVPAGTANQLITIGYQPSVAAGFLIALPVGYLGLGLHTAVNYFQASGYTASAHSLLVPVAFDVRVETLNERLFRLFARLTGGAALMALFLEPAVTKVLPFASAGAGVEVPFRGRGGLKIAVNYEVYFEQPYLIMGYSPEVGLYWRF